MEELKSLKIKAYDFIKERIFSCYYMPGDFLDEKSLINEIGASRTPIREALNKIEQENLVQIIAKKGIMVKQITAKNVIDIFQVRETIEPNAIFSYGKNFDLVIMEEFRQRFLREETDPLKHYKLDDEYHSYIISVYNNEYISRIMKDIYGQNYRIRILTGEVKNCTSFAQNEHLEIADFIIAGDYLKAGESLKKHLELSRERTLSMFIANN